MKTKLWLAPLGLLLALGACNDQLIEEPKAFLTTDTFYKTPADLQSGVLAVYAQLRTALNFGSFAFYGPDDMSDQAMTDPGETTAQIIAMNQVFWNATETNFTDAAWSPLYTLIYRANLVIQKAPEVQMAEAAKAQWVAEAKFLRAHAYLHLSKRHSAGGTDAAADVPLLLTLEDHAAAEISRSTTAQVHAQIVKDLTEAEAALPATQTGASAGRATRGAAQMALADLYTWRSSFLKSNEWQKASDWAKKVIDSGLYGLNDGYFATFLPANRGNREMIFRLVAAPDNRANTTAVNTYFPRALGFSPAGGGFGVSQPTTWLLSSYAPGDIRGSVGPQSDSVAYRTSGTTTAGVTRTITPHVWKYRPSSVDNALGDVDVPLYRYAEALLFYGEAQVELGNVATGVGAVNQVRARARKGTGAESRAQPADLPSSLSQAAARDALYNERNWELSFESKRWFDLVRRDALEPGFFRAALAHDPAAGQRAPVTDVLKRFPIPGTEIERMPSISQNPGY
jgi:starch-binding outer membrane protein, SusD/RagB family